MIWAILALIRIPLWLFAIGIVLLLLNNREPRKRPATFRCASCIPRVVDAEVTPSGFILLG